MLEVRDLWPQSMVDAGVMREGGAPHRLFRALEVFLYRSAKQIVAVTGGWEAHFAEAGVDFAKVHVVPNGASIEDFVVDADRDDLRREYGLNRFTAIFAGAHGPKDGLQKIREAASQVPDIDILLVGSGTKKAGLIKEVEKEGLANVRFMEPVSKGELPRLLTACDVGIHAVSGLSVFEQGMSPNKLFDYLAAGLPIVSNAESALASIVGQDECGRLGGPDDLGRLLGEVRDAPAHVRERWSLNGRRCIAQRFSRDRSAAVLVDTLQQALA